MKKLIEAQIRYNQWIFAHRNQLQPSVDNTERTIEETARLIAKYAERLLS